MRKRWVAVFVLCALALAACSDDGNDTRSGSASGSGSGSGSGSASGGGSGSGSGISASDVEGTTDDEAILEATAAYKQYVEQQVDELVTKTTTFTDAVRVGDLAAAQAAYAPSREPWERIEPIAGLIEDIDGAVDARVDDFEGEDDPAWTGWHRLEYLLFAQNTTEGATEFADKLDADLAKLQSSLANLEMPPAALAVGAAELIEEVSEGKITGEEDRYSHTDLWDFAANVEGSKHLITLLTPALEAKDPELLGQINEQFAEVEAELAPYEDGDGYRSYEELTDADKEAMTASLAALSESLSQVAGTLGLE